MMRFARRLILSPSSLEEGLGVVVIVQGSLAQPYAATTPNPLL